MKQSLRNNKNPRKTSCGGGVPAGKKEQEPKKEPILAGTKKKMLLGRFGGSPEPSIRRRMSRPVIFKKGPGRKRPKR